ncbi:lysylphosphatidylglycerol synthase domain-containing protein [Clostridium septicum]|uniref:Phosphatidylglycerol lysyltransferase n=1 Tax=Clostridium septicum TaxID=1504 RepID=A0A9N7JMI3_CLOSE|nr:lysylphosphatidylglycerol synthase domain-containing protein [Clostridium septicum]AYE35384.1 lysylphosphatidylglycerol synthetase family protein [Clostridium septicum]MDU1315245.1 lysylphosphatidylglycerol synthase domain-containing protein [Clostridium septicum]QAS60773.1 UPF0104 family protein [Clostridium septicum]UEC19962.1 lysylphosphatidylglycerol synthase domain-containing protein [Clostridium septicum]USS01980.1 lysylphosphatidylglycerol synthase domain-containing protein [Clostrid
MKKIINNLAVRIIQILVMAIILVVVTKELYRIFIDMNIQLFYKYSDKLTVVNIFIIVLLGIISYIPLSFYDLVIRKKVGIALDTKKVYKYSWIASSVANIVGFGGSAAIVLKRYFYKDYVDDEKKLIKETSKVVGLNLSGFSLLCLIYSIYLFTIERNISYIDYIAIIIAMYLPIIIITITYKYIKNGDRYSYRTTLKIISISILEWITTISLIIGLIYILNINVSIFDFLPIYVVGIVAAIISMAPSGLGTFDLVLIVGLDKFNVPKEQVLLLIILYRISYYIIPLLIGVILYLSDLLSKLVKNENME